MIKISDIAARYFFRPQPQKFQIGKVTVDNGSFPVDDENIAVFILVYHSSSDVMLHVHFTYMI